MNTREEEASAVEAMADETIAAISAFAQSNGEITLIGIILVAEWYRSAPLIDLQKILIKAQINLIMSYIGFYITNQIFKPLYLRDDSAT